MERSVVLLPRPVWLMWLVLMAQASACAAETLSAIGGSLSWTSDYVLRGISQSNNEPTWQTDGHIEPIRGWRVGVWAAGVELLPPKHFVELDAYLSKPWILGRDLALTTTLTHYAYVNDPRLVSYTYNELNAMLNWRDTWSLGVSWSPDSTLIAPPYDLRRNQRTLTWEGSIHGALPGGFEWQGGMGYFDPLDLHEGDYWFGSARLARRIGPIGAELGWFWTQDRTHRTYTLGKSGGPWVLTLTYGFEARN